MVGPRVGARFALLGTALTRRAGYDQALLGDDSATQAGVVHALGATGVNADGHRPRCLMSEPRH